MIPLMVQQDYKPEGWLGKEGLRPGPSACTRARSCPYDSTTSQYDDCGRSTGTCTSGGGGPGFRPFHARTGFHADGASAADDAIGVAVATSE
jgi:hypothetical protein